MRVWIALAAALIAASPAHARPKAGPDIAGVGDVIFHDELKAPLPNAWGKPDIFGHKVVVGTVEVRYLGLAPDGQARFERSDVQIVSNETTLTRARGTPTLPAAMPPVVMDLTVDLQKDPTLFVNGQTIRILNASGSRVTYEVAR